MRHPWVCTNTAAHLWLRGDFGSECRSRLQQDSVLLFGIGSGVEVNTLWKTGPGYGVTCYSRQELEPVWTL